MAKTKTFKLDYINQFEGFFVLNDYDKMILCYYC